jgi:hypothetical protein
MKTFFKVWLGIALIAIGFGIAILILATANGVSWRNNVKTYSINESYEGVRSLDFDIGYGEVNIEEGSTFSIDAENMVSDGFESYVSGGTWYIREKYDSMVDIFGWKFSLKQIIHWGDYSPDITITIPRDFVAESFILDIGAGEVDADEIHAVDGAFSVDAGRLKIDRLTVNERSTYNVGTGEMILNDIAVNDITVECGIGNVDIYGTITGDNEITCGIGRIKLDLTGDEDDYSYRISAGIGNVVIDNRSYHSIDKSINNDSDNNLKLDCGIGNITVEFN